MGAKLLAGMVDNSPTTAARRQAIECGGHWQFLSALTQTQSI